MKKYCPPPPEGELTTAIHVDVTAIPDYVRDDLAAATLAFVRGLLRLPGGRELLDAKIAARQEK